MSFLLYFAFIVGIPPVLPGPAASYCILLYTAQLQLITVYIGITLAVTIILLF
jgi:hypothetical protein